MARILIIDDYPAILEVIGLILRTAGYEVTTASTGMAGLQMAGATFPDLVLLDVDMPVWDGMRVCTELKKNPRTAHIPVLLMTGWDLFRLSGKIGVGENGILSKPLERKRLLGEIERVLNEVSVT